MSLLEVNELKLHFPIHGGVFYRQVGTVYAVDGVSFTIDKGKTLGLVGESGCGKSTIGRTLVGLYQPTSGQVAFQQQDISGLHRNELKQMRSNLQMIFQDPFESLNPRYTIGDILAEPFVIHGQGNRREIKKAVASLLDRVGLSMDALNKYPHEFSGGQRQRVGIARAIALHPKLIICDEPVSALDVSIQSQILNLLLDLQQEMDMAYLFIAHDLAVVKHVSDQIAVMYLGRIVEIADAADIYSSPMHPYTQALISAVPRPDPRDRQEFKPLSGEVPSPINPPLHCHFVDRCPRATDRCRTETPYLRTLEQGNDSHQVACHFPG